MGSTALLIWLLRELSGESRPSGGANRRRRPANDHPRVVRGRQRKGPPEPATHQPPSLPLPPVVAVDEPHLAIRCFGRFEVSRSGKPVQDWRRVKARSLLKYLVNRRHPVPRDVVMDLLWPQSDATAAGNSLRVALHALRHALGAFEAGPEEESDYVILSDGSLSLNPAARVWVDVEAFSAHVAAGVCFERQRRTEDAIREYECAEALYRDDYLIEDMYADWTISRREELKDQYLLLITRLADWSLQRGDLSSCILRCHRIVEKDPCREDAYRRLMRCYHHLGQRSQALHWYDLCSRALRRELDSAPSESTTRLHQRILGTSPSPSAPFVSAPTPPAIHPRG